MSSAGAAVDVMDDVHHLEHDARPLLVRALARRDQEQVARRQSRRRPRRGSPSRTRARGSRPRRARRSSSRPISSSDSGSNSLRRRNRSTSAWSANARWCQSITESPRSMRRTASTSASVSSASLGRPRDARQDGRRHPSNHAGSRPAYERRPPFVNRNVAANKPTTPRPTRTLPMTAIMVRF